MSSSEILENALKTAGLPVKYYEYEGTKPEYVVYNEEAEEPANFGDNKAENRITWWQVHIFTPKQSDFRKWKEEIKKRLLAAGFHITDITTLYEKETKTIHVVISCHMGESEDEKCQN